MSVNYVILFSTFAIFGTLLVFYGNNNNSTNFTKRLIAQDITNILINNIKWANIRDNLRKFTTEPHPAGTSANSRVAEKIANLWKQNGLKDVHFIKYNVLLSYPNYLDPNRITIFDSKTNKIIFENTGVSPAILPNEQGTTGAGIQWLAYSPNGIVEADVVYCHYGTEEDFKRLKGLNISVKGKIALMRYHTEFRGSKIKNAQLNGAVGAIIYTDPMEFASDGTEHVYPHSVWMPDEGVQRGSIKNMNGDSLTPLYPSRSDMFKAKTIEMARENGDLPLIPALPLSYSDAYQILSRLTGLKAPKEWQGSLNVTYRLGAGFKGDKKFKMRVNSKLVIREIKNVIGYLYGASEPDEYVMLGNHYDAWVYGSIDPNSATATLAEVARAFVRTTEETGWRPARTLVFCNWDAEEYGLIGSTEFSEDFTNLLTDRAVIYLNVDLISGNYTFNADTIPTLYDAVVEASQKIPNPVKTERDLGRATVYDTWIKNKPDKMFQQSSQYPIMQVPGGGSDHSSFLTYLGIPVVDFRYSNATQSYPLYHSLYETHYVNEMLIDPDHLAVHTAVGQYWAELARSFADAEILPLNVTMFAYKILNDYVSELNKTLINVQHNNSLKPAIQQFKFLEKKCQEFLINAKDFQNAYNKKTNFFQKNISDNVFETSPLSPARINRRLKAVDRCFVNPRGNQEGAVNRHVLYSLNNRNTYASSIMSSVYNELENFKAANSTKKVDAGRKVAKEISIVQYSVQCAINTLFRII